MFLFSRTPFVYDIQMKDRVATACESLPLQFLVILVLGGQ